jgi:hypothetical protein
LIESTAKCPRIPRFLLFRGILPHRGPVLPLLFPASTGLSVLPVPIEGLRRVRHDDCKKILGKNKEEGEERLWLIFFKPGS